MEKPDLYVVTRFLEILYDAGSPMKKTRIQRLLGLRYPRFTEYLEWLLEHGLVEKVPDDDDIETVTLTTKGVDSYHKLVAWIKDTMEGVQIRTVKAAVRQRKQAPLTSGERVAGTCRRHVSLLIEIPLPRL